jgi:hypothetical protein
MFNDLDWLMDDSLSVCIDFNAPSPSVILFRDVACMRKHAYGDPLTAGRDFIIIGGLEDFVAAVEFSRSPVIRDIHSAIWGGK